MIILKSFSISPQTKIEIPTKSYADSSHENNRIRRDFSSKFNDEDKELDNTKLSNLDSITVYRNPNLDNELSNKKYNVDSMGKRNVLRLNQTTGSYLKVSDGNDTYNVTKYD